MAGPTAATGVVDDGKDAEILHMPEHEADA
jgi:hypothetical protein